MNIELPVRATLLRRYKRFLADVELPDGSVLTAHCPNTGAMTGCAEPGSPVWLSVSDSATRKYPHTLELVETSRGLACVHSARANHVVAEGLAAGVVDELAAYPVLQREVKYDQASRIDLLLSGPPGRVFVEVKCVTLCCDDGVGLFPDAVSERGRRHLEALSRIAAEKDTRAVLFYCVFHNGINSVSAAGEIDRRYRDTLAEVVDAGVEVLAWRARIEPTSLCLTEPLPFSLDPPPISQQS